MVFRLMLSLLSEGQTAQCFSFPLSQLPPLRCGRRKGSRTSADRAVSGGSEAALSKGRPFARPVTPPLLAYPPQSPNCRHKKTPSSSLRHFGGGAAASAQPKLAPADIRRILTVSASAACAGGQRTTVSLGTRRPARGAPARRVLAPRRQRRRRQSSEGQLQICNQSARVRARI